MICDICTTETGNIQRLDGLRLCRTCASEYRKVLKEGWVDIHGNPKKPQHHQILKQKSKHERNTATAPNKA